MTEIHVESKIRTRFLVLSDTHGRMLGRPVPDQPVDVVLHCGDLTEHSSLEEFAVTLSMLRSTNAPLKLVIPGNHDWAMDLPIYRHHMMNHARHAKGIKLPHVPMETRYGDEGAAASMFEDEDKLDENGCDRGIHLLSEGTHRFRLANGAALTVFASPYTPMFGAWAFQYWANEGHNFEVAEGTDVVMTHGPPRGVLDMVKTHEHAGCPDLFATVSQVQPALHCFGHIHEAWGATMVTWQPSAKTTGVPAYDDTIDHFGTSRPICDLQRLRPYPTVDDAATQQIKKDAAAAFAADRCCSAEHNGQPGQTLFVNAAIKGDAFERMHLPWVVTLKLPRASILDPL